ncbi:hypothetical protein F8388_017123 [Cannabis sativa]|uniref:Uncharacterized protein n=1 Tax=Cannabis sativa TaxID=3483 RepID=A0A7J6GF82_CANSA|nr:hypothetical protein F8388_017123 [Cannabis sativa]KAF4401880.1 hypothetical protein G4B88_017392 [Cannabis sativa]
MMMRNMGSTNPNRGIAAVVGVGPKLGRSIARKFAHEGYTVAILARDLGKLSRFADEIAREEKAQVFAIRIDCSDSRSVKEAFEGVLSLGFVEILVYNAYQPLSNNWHPSNFTDIRIDSFEKSLAVSSVGAFHCAQQFALRGLSQCLAKEFQPLGIHIAHVIIDGLIGSPRGSGSSSAQRITSSGIGEHTIQSGGGGGGDGSIMDPDAVAQTYWYLHLQDRTTWTQEIDLRPSTTTFT